MLIGQTYIGVVIALPDLADRDAHVSALPIDGAVRHEGLARTHDALRILDEEPIAHEAGPPEVITLVSDGCRGHALTIGAPSDTDGRLPKTRELPST